MAGATSMDRMVHDAINTLPTTWVNRFNRLSSAKQRDLLYDARLIADRVLGHKINEPPRAELCERFVAIYNELPANYQAQLAERI